ncbi:MAG: DUF485 domain-containing protein [Cellvibrionaceae bacterium]|nr:DUF485 domain-containing protein [Cellvibrionaceae bacterium]
MSDPKDLKRLIQKKNRLRLIMGTVIVALYLGFALGYGPLQQLFASKMGDSLIPFGLVYFVGLIFGFIALELVYLTLVKRYDPDKGEVSHYAE